MTNEMHMCVLFFSLCFNCLFFSTYITYIHKYIVQSIMVMVKQQQQQQQQLELDSDLVKGGNIFCLDEISWLLP